VNRHCPSLTSATDILVTLITETSGPRDGVAA